VIYIYNPSNVGGLKYEASPGQKQGTISEKYINQQGLGSMAQVVEHLTSKHEALNSKPQYFLNTKETTECTLPK
jgi:hypothetical protein